MKYSACGKYVFINTTVYRPVKLIHFLRKSFFTFINLWPALVNMFFDKNQ